MRERTKKIVLAVSFAIITFIFLYYSGIRPFTFIEEFIEYRKSKNEMTERYESDYHGTAFSRYADEVNYGSTDKIIDIESIPAYEGNQYYIINNNYPCFNEEDFTKEAGYQNYSALDDLGRCRSNMAVVCQSTKPIDSKRGINNSYIEPTGWQIINTKNSYGITLDDDTFYLYNRCHLLAYSLAAEGGLESDEDFSREDLPINFQLCNSEHNLITGTRQFNLAMTDYEQKINKYISKKKTNSVMYRVTPVFEGNNLVAKGAILEALDLQGGRDIRFCVFVYNVQDKFTIDYASGDATYNG